MNINDYMSDSDIDKEMDFWQEYIQPKQDFKHKNFYINFFDFTKITGDILEIGCGGSPFTTYVENRNEIKLSLLDPLIDKIIEIPRYNFLTKYTRYNSSLLDSNINHKYDFIICLNVLDHFINGHIEFLNKIKNLLKDSGKIFLYYDIRKNHADGHYALDHDMIHKHIINNFIIYKESINVNPIHHNWSTVYASYRGVLG